MLQNIFELLLEELEHKFDWMDTKPDYSISIDKEIKSGETISFEIKQIIEC
jgi:hypothetical protein